MGKKSILYIILRAGRIGTTLVDILLGNDESIFSVGELNGIPKRGGVAPGPPKGSTVQTLWSRITDHYDLQSIFLQSEQIEYGAGFFRRKKKLQRAYEYCLRQLYGNTFDAIAEDVLVESSKYPMRAYHLARVFPKEFQHCIYVKNHPVGVLRFQKKGLEQPDKSSHFVSFYLMVVHLLSSFVVRKLNQRGVKALGINFEEILNDLFAFLESVENSFGLDLSHSKNR